MSDSFVQQAVNLKRIYRTAIVTAVSYFYGFISDC